MSSALAGRIRQLLYVYAAVIAVLAALYFVVQPTGLGLLWFGLVGGALVFAILSFYLLAIVRLSRTARAEHDAGIARPTPRMSRWIAFSALYRLAGGVFIISMGWRQILAGNAAVGAFAIFVGLWFAAWGVLRIFIWRRQMHSIASETGAT